MRALTVFTYSYSMRECVCSTSKSPRSACIFPIYFSHGKNIHLLLLLLFLLSFFFHSHKIVVFVFCLDAETNWLFFLRKKGHNLFFNFFSIDDCTQLIIEIETLNISRSAFNKLIWFSFNCLQNWSTATTWNRFTHRYAISCIISWYSIRIWIFFWF